MQQFPIDPALASVLASMGVGGIQGQQALQQQQQQQQQQAQNMQALQMCQLPQLSLQQQLQQQQQQQAANMQALQMCQLPQLSLQQLQQQLQQQQQQQQALQMLYQQSMLQQLPPMPTEMPTEPQPTGVQVPPFPIVVGGSSSSVGGDSGASQACSTPPDLPVVRTPSRGHKKGDMWECALCRKFNDCPLPGKCASCNNAGLARVWWSRSEARAEQQRRQQQEQTQRQPQAPQATSRPGIPAPNMPLPITVDCNGVTADHQPSPPPVVAGDEGPPQLED